MDIYESLEQLNVSEECFNEIMYIVEDIINEVSVGMWKRAAQNSLEGRKKEAKEANNNYEKVIDKVDNMKRVSRKAGEEWDNASGHAFDAEERRNHALEIADLPNSKMSANKVKRAARNSFEGRKQEMNKIRDKARNAYEKGKIGIAAHSAMQDPSNYPRFSKARYVGSNFRKNDWK